MVLTYVHWYIIIIKYWLSCIGHHYHWNFMRKRRIANLLFWERAYQTQYWSIEPDTNPGCFLHVLVHGTCFPFDSWQCVRRLYREWITCCLWLKTTCVLSLLTREGVSWALQPHWTKREIDQPSHPVHEGNTWYPGGLWYRSPLPWLNAEDQCSEQAWW